MLWLQQWDKDAFLINSERLSRRKLLNSNFSVEDLVEDSMNNLGQLFKIQRLQVGL